MYTQKQTDRGYGPQTTEDIDQMRNKSTKKNRRKSNKEKSSHGGSERSEEIMKIEVGKIKKETMPYISHQIRNTAIMSSGTK
jgi:hypothetical protein